ncbi:MAG: cbb3-type cytochrome oxidase assembly protein CcoS [Alphaproteobacteria bacterium]|jgi:cbb3-type cytochrome oxidase maturation protein
MNSLLFLIPLSLFIAFLGLFAFIWSVKNNQYEDLDGESKRILFEEETNKDDK